jgi:hypothetical protein
MPQAQEKQETVNVRTPGGKVIPILKSDLATAIKRGAIPVNTAKEAAAKPDDDNSYIESLRGGMGFDPKGGVKSDIKDLGTGGKFMGRHPLESIKLMLESLSKAQQGTIDKAYEEQHSDDWAKKMHGFIRGIYASIPGGGPLMEHAGEQFEKGKIKGGLGTMTPMLFAEAAKSPVGQRVALEAADLPGKAVTGVKKGASAVTREVAGAPLKEINKAQAATEAANAEKVAAKTAEQSQAKAKARGEYEAAEVKRKAEADTAKKKFAEETAAAAKEKVAQSKAETARRSYEDLRDKHAESTAENLDKAEKMEKLSLDARYEDFRKKVLGVSKEFPNGTLEADLSSVGEAVVNARKNILKGSAESIKQFNDILGKLKDFIETPEGDLKPLPGQKITADQLHGYVTELNEKLYDSGVSGDVRDALKHVRDRAEGSVTDSIGKAHGKTAVKAYSDLKGDYNDYMDTWRDTASGSPLPAIRKILRQPMATKRGIPVYREVADILEGAKGEKALPVIARKRAFGADPALAARLRKAGEKLSSLPKPKEVKPVERPELPKEPTETKFEAPKPAEVEPFDRRKFVEEKVGRRAGQIERYSLVVPAFQLLYDIVNGKMPGPEMAVGPAMGMAIKKLLTSDKVLDWLSKEGETKGTAPVTERRSPTSTGKGPGGIGRRATEQSVVEETTLRDAIKRDLKALENKNLSPRDRGVIERHLADFREMLAEL